MTDEKGKEKVSNTVEWQHVSMRVKAIKEKLDQIKAIAPNIEKANIKTLKVMQKQLEDLIVEIHEVMEINYYYFVKKNVDAHDYFESVLVSLEESAYRRMWKISHIISNKETIVHSKAEKQRKNKFEYLFRNFSPIENNKFSEEDQLINAHNELKKAIKSIDEKPLDGMMETDTTIYRKVSKCIKSYEEHYGEVPTSEMISDIIGAPVSVVEKVMESIQFSSKKL